MALWKPDPTFHPSPRDVAGTFFPHGGSRPHRTRLQGDDASSDPYRHP